MKVVIEQDEWYPVFLLTDREPSKHNEVGDLTEDEIARIKAAEKEFNECQDLLRASRCRVSGHQWKSWSYDRAGNKVTYWGCEKCAEDMPTDQVPEAGA
jgi:hypothetical protein